MDGVDLVAAVEAEAVEVAPAAVHVPQQNGYFGGRGLPVLLGSQADEPDRIRTFLSIKLGT